MQQAITMRQLTAGAPQEPREAPQTAAEDAGGVEARLHRRGSGGRTAPPVVAQVVRGTIVGHHYGQSKNGRHPWKTHRVRGSPKRGSGRW